MKKVFISFIFLLGFISLNVNAQWVETGFENTAYPQCIAGKDNKLYVGTRGHGILRSTDGGATFTAANNGLPDYYGSSVNALTVAQSLNGGSVLYAGMEYGGIFRSDDDGENWTWVYPGGVLGEHNINIVNFGVAGNTVLACVAQEGTDNGIYRSNDDGGSWTKSNSGLGAVDLGVRCFASVKIPGTTYTYAGTDDGVYVSTTDGSGWTSIGLSGIVFAVAASPAVNGSNNINLFAATVKGVFHSTDNGANWVDISSAFNPYNVPYINSFAVTSKPGASTNTIFAASSNDVYLSNDNGLSWVKTGFPASVVGPPWNIYLYGDYMFSGIFQGFRLMKYSVAPDTNWVVQSSGTSDSLTCVKAVDNNVVWIGGTNGAVLRTTNGGIQWDSAGGGTIGAGLVTSIEAINSSTALVSSFSSNTGEIFRTTNGGTSWQVVYSLPGCAFGGIQMRNSLEGYAVGTPSGGKWKVLKTTDGGNTWDSLTTAPAADNLMVDAISANGPLLFRPVGVQLLGNALRFAALSGRLYLSTDFGLTWTYSTTNDSGFYPGALHFNSSTQGIVGGYEGGATFSTINGGNAWNTGDSTGNQGISCISGVGDEYWATTGDAIAYTKNMGQSWTFASPGHWGLTALTAVNFSPVSSPLNGWAVGASGLILHYQHGGAITGAQDFPLHPSKSELVLIQPNPIITSATIKFVVAEQGVVLIKVFDITGKEVTTLLNEQMPDGSYSVEWNASGLPGGVYLCRFQSNNICGVKKMLLIK